MSESSGAGGRLAEEDQDQGMRGEADGWKADENLVAMLCNMGISKNIAEKALFFTGNSSAELAAAYIFENPESDLDAALDMYPDIGASCGDSYKMVFVVNSELKMGIGKSAAQVAHASVALYRILLRDQSTFAEMLFNWEDSGETKIVVNGDNAQHLTALQEKALSFGLPHYLVRDAGKTQIPSGSVTVLAVMGLASKVDTITGELKLL